jgi:glycosidase
VRAPLERAQPDLAMLAEADDPALLRSAFNVDYAWEFYHAVSDALVGNAPASTVRAVWERDAARYPRGALRLRFSDNHDQMRTTGAAGLPAALAASALMFTLDGVPLIYNGMEVGDTTESAAPALFERVPIAWQMAERRPPIPDYYKALAQLRRAHPALTRSGVRWLANGDQSRILSFERAAAEESLVVVINLSSQPWSGRVESGEVAWRDITPTWRPAVAQSAANPAATRRSALPDVALGAWEFRVFSRAKP